jgi:hypothetical protein
MKIRLTQPQGELELGLSLAIEDNLKLNSPSPTLLYLGFALLK